MTNPNPERFTDDMAPTAVGRASTYAPAAAGPTRQAPLTADGTVLGYVWTDDRQAAGWAQEAQTRAAVLAGAYVWSVLAAAFRRGDPAAAVLSPELYAPLYELGGAQ